MSKKMIFFFLNKIGLRKAQKLQFSSNDKFDL